MKIGELKKQIANLPDDMPVITGVISFQYKGWPSDGIVRLAAGTFNCVSVQKVECVPQAVLCTKKEELTDEN